MAHFTKRHYEFTAQSLRERIPSAQYRADIAEALADIFASDNPAFERWRFYTACQVTEYFERTGTH